MSTLSQFSGGGVPIGSYLYAPYNINDPAYLPCQGQIILRSAAPLYAALQPVGTFTPTIRTKALSHSYPPIFANAANFVMPGPLGTSAIQTSADGVTYTARTTPSIGNVVAILGDGTNIVALPDNTGVTPTAIYSTNGGVNWTSTATANISASPNSGQPSVLCHAPTLGAVGRFLFVRESQVVTSDDRGVTWTAYNHGTGYSFVSVCHTGTKYVALTLTLGIVMTSTTGLTGSWTPQAVAFSQSWGTSQGHIISDGAGRVLIVDTTLNLITTSTDHLATFSQRQFAPGGFANTGAAPLGPPSYANGRFFIPTSSAGGVVFWVSSDLSGWLNMPNVRVSSASGFCCVAHKAGVYLASVGGGTQALSMVEDTTRVYLPAGVQTTGSAGNGNNFNSYVRVK